MAGLQRILQAVSDPFLGHLRVSDDNTDCYVRQFHDMKRSIEMETLEDSPFRRYADICATTLARAHVQSQAAADVAGYIGVVGEAIPEWHARTPSSRWPTTSATAARGIEPVSA